MECPAGYRGVALLVVVCLLLVSLGTGAAAHGREWSPDEAWYESVLRYLLDARVEALPERVSAADRLEDDRNALSAILGEYEGIETSLTFLMVLQITALVQEGMAADAAGIVSDLAGRGDVVALLVHSKLSLLQEEPDRANVAERLAGAGDRFSQIGRPRLAASARLDAADVYMELGDARTASKQLTQALSAVEVAPVTTWQEGLASGILARSAAKLQGDLGGLVPDPRAWTRMSDASRLASLELARIQGDPAAPASVKRTAARESAYLYSSNWSVLTDEQRTWGPPATRELRESYAAGLARSRDALKALKADTSWLRPVAPGTVHKIGP